MAYKPLEVRIMPGGLNLLAPGDQVAAGDCLDLNGWWPGAAGRLQQAPGYTYVSASHLTGVTWFDGLCESSGHIYYSGGGSLFGVGMGGGGETAIDSGYGTAYPLGMLSAQGYLWAMSQSRQMKDDGSGSPDAWTPAAPSVPTLTNPDLTGATLTSCECDPASPIEGGFTQINCFSASSVAGIEVGGTATITGLTGTAAPMNGTWPVKAIYEGSSNLLILEASLPATTVYGMGGTAAVRNPGMEVATHNYSITWVFPNLGESNPCTVVPKAVTQAGTKITISIAALTPPASASGWNLYRQSPSMATAYLVNLTPIPKATTTYDDFGDAAHFQDDAYLTESVGVQLEGDHDAAPACAVLGNQVYNGRIVAANSSAYPNRVWYTPALQPSFFRGSGNPQAGDWVDIGTDRGDAILFLSVKPGQILVYRQKSIWRILADFDDPNGRIDVVVPDLGVVGVRAVAPTSLGDYFRASEGIYKFNGDWAQKISPKLDPIFRGLAAENFPGENATYRKNCALGFHAGRLWCSFTDGGGSTTNDNSFVWHAETDRWFVRGPSFGAYLDRGTTFYAAGAYDVVSLESGWVDGVGNTILAYQGAYEDCGQPDHEKSFADLVVNHNTGGQTLTVKVRQNKAAVAADSFDLDTTLTSSALTKTVVPLVYPAAYSVVALRGEPIRAHNLSIRITGTGPNASPGVVIDGPLVLHYYLEARKGRVFDTDETDHGLPGVVKTVDEVEFDIDASAGAGTLQIYSDIPGGAAMTARLGGGVAIAQTAGRQTVRIVLATPVEGKLLRYLATTTTSFCVYGFRARLTPIGVYVDGAISEIWDTRPMPLLTA